MSPNNHLISSLTPTTTTIAIKTTKNNRKRLKNNLEKTTILFPTTSNKFVEKQTITTNLVENPPSKRIKLLKKRQQTKDNETSSPVSGMFIKVFLNCL